MTNKILIRLKPFDRLEIPNLEISSPSHCNFTFFRCYEVKKTETATSMLVTDVEDKKKWDQRKIMANIKPKSMWHKDGASSITMTARSSFINHNIHGPYEV